jgi:heterodisulfide reductase subunit A
MGEITLEVDGRVLKAKENMTVLEVARDAGINIPTLCYHEALAPFGACRLCVVEIISRGRSKLLTACTYPAEEGLVVQTNSPKVLKARKMVIELLLARCPNVKVIQDLAREYGIEKPRFKKLKDDDCILCGLCTRICQERMGVSAVGFIGRGISREVDTPFGKPSDACLACGACASVCPTGAIKLEDIKNISKNEPIPLLSEFDTGLRLRSPIYVPYPQGVPNVPVIDRDSCVHYLTGECKICETVCKAGAIKYDQEDEIIELEAGAVILAPGYELFNPEVKPELGYGRFPNVITSLEFERILSASGPYAGEISRPYDRKRPEKIAFIQCVGSREVETNYCSAVCCMYATKEAILVKEHHPETDITIFFIDLRAFGKGFERYYERAKNMGIKYVRFKPSSVDEIPGTKDLNILYQKEDGKTVAEKFDLVVLSCGLTPPSAAEELAEKFNIELNEFGFCQTGLFTPVETSQEGVYACGLFTGPKDIPETVMQGSAAASKTLALLSAERGKLVEEKTYPPERDVTGEEPRIGVFVCHCGKNIASVVNVSEVVEYVNTLPNVVHAEDNLYTCSTDAAERIKQVLDEYNLNRLIVASCTPRTHEPLFQDTLREAGLNPYLFEMANIRDQCSWVHMHQPEEATRKAKDLVRIAVAKSRLLEPLYPKFVDVNHDALVIGGGAAGMTAALELAEQGFETHLLEKSDQLGGNLTRVKFLLNGENPQARMESLVEQVQNHPKIHIYTGSEILNFEGSAGNFRTEFSSNGDVHAINHGAVIVATGAEEYKPTEYLYGQDEGVITQLELEDSLTKDNFGAKSVVMIQCVGSREEPRLYCSRICCSEGVKNALKIKEKSPGTNVFLLYRDLRTYGFSEAYYREAREKGIRFIRYEVDQKPEVSRDNGRLKVSVYDQLLGAKININCDLVTLAAATIPRDGNKDLAQKLKLPLTEDGFFLEAHMKLRPVDFASDGIFLCGLAHSPKSIDESIAQASAAAARASTILSKSQIQLEAAISEVVDENCDGCAYCVDPCPYDAITLLEYMKDGAIKKTVESDPAKCRGCGVCMATCPKQGIFVRNFRIDQISAMADAALGVG